jgi:threonyl-tRNA synthetase
MKQAPSLEIMRHSAAHLLAAAMQELLPEAKFGIGPVIENGFYYDFDLPRTLIPEDLSILEEKMRELIKQDLPFERTEVPIEEAIKSATGQPYKLELLEEIKRGERESIPKTETNAPRNPGASSDATGGSDKTVTFYRVGDFVDLCKGPHVKNTGQIGAFRLTKIAGAYWKGSEKNPQLQRVYGVAFKTKKELDEYLDNLEEAEKRDHRKLGKELDIFISSAEIGPGLPLFTDKGNVIRRLLTDYERELLGDDYQEVATPHIAKVDLYKKSGHYPYYEDSQFPVMERDGESYLLKPMNCPHHIQIYADKSRSYRDLPVRIFECGTCYRYEKSGEVSGLTRVRSLTIDDGHLFVREDQIEGEIEKLINIVEKIYSTFGFEPRFELSYREPNNTAKYAGSDATWKKSEDILRAILKNHNLPSDGVPGEAAFYGPKIDMFVKDSMSREHQLATIQLDFNLPERFELSYIDEQGNKIRPVMIHRAIYGSLERFMGVLIEHYAGTFPLWLAPVQVKVLPVSDDQNETAAKIQAELRSADIRAELDDRSEGVGKKIRDAELQKIPYMVIVGPKEDYEKTSKVAIRSRGGEQSVEKLAELIKKLQAQINDRAS